MIYKVEKTINVKKILLVFLFLSLCHSHEIFSRVLKDIHVSGNVRIEKEAILNEIPYKKGQEYDTAITATILKTLNKTEYFDNVSVDIQDDVITIFVVENPIINRIAYEGMRFSVRDTLKDIVKLRARQVFSKPVIQETQQTILEIYRRQGYLSARVTPKIVKLPDNRVDVVFEVKEGSPAYVRKVAFTGNTAFLSSELRELLVIKAKQWFHLGFLGGTRNKVYDPEKFVEDQQSLVRFYLSQGYADFEIVSATAELSSDKRDFFITYYLREGDLYKFGNITVDSKIEKLNSKQMQASIMAKKGSIFNGQMVEICSDILKTLASTSGYNFAVVDPVFKKNAKTKTVDVCFVIKDGPKVSIEKIDIKGNRHTRDYVIRRELGFVEGDSFDYKQVKNAEQRVKSLEFFKDVKVEPSEGSDPGRAIITVSVEEDRTGEVFGRVGYSTLDHMNIEARIFDPNFRGRAQSLEFLVSYAKKTLDGSIELAEPHLWGRNLYGSASLFHTRSKKMTGLLRTQTGCFTSLGYHISHHIIQNWTYKLHRENLEEDKNKDQKKDEKKAQKSSENIANQKAYEDWLKSDDGKNHAKFVNADDDYGSAWGSAIIHSLSYDCRNRRMLPSRGFKISWTTKISGLGGSIKHMINTWSGSWHHRLFKDVTLNLRASFSHARGLGNKSIRVVDALYLGGDSFRGFDFYGISPLRGISKDYMEKIFDQFITKSSQLDYLTEEQKKFLSDKQEKIKKVLILQENLDLEDSFKWMKILEESGQHNQTDARQIHDLFRIRGKRLGATLSWIGSLELTFPMPILPRDAEVFGTIFFDMGSAWRSKRKDKEDESSVLYDKHTLRTSAGFCIAWNSPFGLLNAGYAWPIKKESGDILQKFLFGYGMKFN